MARYNKSKTVVVAAACKMADGVIVVGARHFDDIMHQQLQAIYGKDHKDWPAEHKQGFIDNRQNFFNREIAAEIAFEAGQITKEYPELYSEDLY